MPLPIRKDWKEKNKEPKEKLVCHYPEKKKKKKRKKKKGDKDWKGGHGRNKNWIKTKKKRSRELPSTYEKKILETKQTKRLKSGGWCENQQLNISSLLEEIKF